MLILGNLGPDQQDLANEITQPLLKLYEVSVCVYMMVCLCERHACLFTDSLG